jgi:hypothetical protein
VQCIATLRGCQVRLRLPPQAAPAEGRPEGADAPMNQSREAHLAAWPLHSPEGAVARIGRSGRQWVCGGIPCRLSVWRELASWWLGGAWGAVTDVALASRGPALGDSVASLVVGDHAFGHPGSLGWLEIGHGVELDGELGSELLELKVDRWPIPEPDPQPDRSS